MITFKQKGDFSKTFRFMESASNLMRHSLLDKYGKMGVEALRKATPKDTGLTSESWDYMIVKRKNGFSIEWVNYNVHDYVNIAIIIQYGHGTRNGGYVQGIDYINPALAPIFERMANDIWKEVTEA